MRFKALLFMAIGVFVPLLVFAQLPNITAMEYFVDNDPGFGNATPVALTAATSIDQTFNIAVGGLTEGFHRVNVRVRDANGAWSITHSQSFYKSSLPTSSQNIVAMEYFLDTDPGFGNATNIPITQNSSVDQSFIVNIGALTEGLHRLYVRTKDASGGWSLTFSQFFYKSNIPTSQQNVVKMEYFVDNDPGFGNATNVSITQNANVDQLFAISITGLTEGFHRLYVRTLDATGGWGHTFSQHFFKSNLPVAPPNLTKLEYYFDADPGYENGIALPLTASPTLDQIWGLDISGISNGVHRIFVRAKDEKGAWSINYTTIFAKNDTTIQPNLVALEYFIDTDPGLGRATAIPMGQGMMFDISKIIDVGYLTQTDHTINFRTRDANGAWSVTHPFTFTKNAATAMTDSCGINSTAVLINVYAQVRITLQPNNIRECVTGTDSLTTTATGGVGSINYQWQRSNDNGATWANIAGATNPMYRPSSTVADSASYRVIASTVGTACTSDTSRTVRAVITAPPVTLIAANNTVICTDGRAILSATLTDNSNSCTIQWQNSPDGVTFANIAGATGNTYTTPNLSSTTRYRTVLSCTASGCCN